MPERNECQTITIEELCEELEQLVLEKEQSEDNLITLEHEIEVLTDKAAL